MNVVEAFGAEQFGDIFLRLFVHVYLSASVELSSSAGLLSALSLVRDGIVDVGLVFLAVMVDCLGLFILGRYTGWYLPLVADVVVGG